MQTRLHQRKFRIKKQRRSLKAHLRGSAGPLPFAVSGSKESRSDSSSIGPKARNNRARGAKQK
ncbi:MAG: hypothetical protein AUJ52_13000 [Elusimicrobia bacterium CG1_02_63_36]|nr:MAG: hypothetical protein AUJ52_13000 [Elusimicrobia bacterium CG1_02_63_36]PIP84306.1 MAG: hypothetical protein COR54_04990 [Elusimicrobia bacterium CG22_combo_CG10-13_8_21_14_all_63_91]PJA15675.1 MAG: hypothetical protein COX66_09560 [Elusimicrobia bacterium CG_4_10_14_0_2_um_filter_63_34]PJB23689.1 MAG: hypothetical protein CO113_17215 [Elusimicrobia bacterium CG_4_9_14_3_um_filter_62_55]